MARIIIKGSYTIQGEIASEKKNISFQVTVPGKPPISVNVIPSEKQIESFQEVEVSNELLRAIEADNYRNMSENLDSELSEINSGVQQAAKKVLHLIKYCFNQLRMEDSLMSIKGNFWSKDGTNFNRLHGRFSVAATTIRTISLNDDSCEWLQEYIDSDYQPFLALRHLHRARNDSNPRYMWIEATIAAELAIKEFLIRQRPELETLLLEVPSPPIYKMYGAILEAYGGKPLPKKISNALSDGAMIRNRLLHRPHDERIDHQKALDYVNAVAEAIEHLLGILYPEYHLAV
jgi:hypothetical protein